MAIVLSDQFFITLALPADARLTNLVLDGSTIRVETQAEYLTRVDYLSRYLGQEVDFLAPAGTYGINDFIAKVNSQDIGNIKYCFENGTADSYFGPCTCCGGGGEGGDVYQAGNNIFTGDNIHQGIEIFEGPVIFQQDGCDVQWTVDVDDACNFVIQNADGDNITIDNGEIITNMCITANCFKIDGYDSLPCFVMSDGTVNCDQYISEYIEEDPIFNAWYNNGNFTVDWSQITNAPDCECSGGGCDFTEQECINIRDLLANPGGGGSIDCTGLLHNELDGLQGGNGVDEYYHLTAAEHAFVEDIVANGSGVLASHTELTDIGVYTHPQIDTHIDDTTIHFTMAEMNANEIDPVFTAERDALTPTYVTMKGDTTLVDSPMRIDEYAYYINGLPIWASHGNSNTSLGSGNGQYYDASAVSNVALGASAGQFIFDHASGNEFPTFGIYLGNFVYPSESNNTNETIIGNNIDGNGSNTVTIGNDSVTDNYFNGNLIITDIFKGEKVEYGDLNIYITSDESGNMIFKDNVVEREYTLTELLGGAGGGWNLAANNDTSVPIVLDNTVSFNGDADIGVERVDKDINISLKPTGVTANTYASPNLTIDENGRIIAAEDAAGCQQNVAQLGTHSTDTTVILDLDNYPHGVITLDSTATVTIDFRHVVNGDTGHIEVNHQGAESLVFSNTLAPDKLIHIAENSRLATNTVKLSPIAATDVVAYWAAIDKIHLAVIYNTLN